MSLTITNPNTLTGSRRPVGIKVVTDLTATSKWVECELTVNGSVLTTFNTYFGESNTVYVYPHKMLSYSIDIAKIHSSSFYSWTSSNAMKTWSISFTEKYISSGVVTTGATASTGNLYSTDTRRDIQDTSMNDYITKDSTIKWLTDRSTILLNSDDWYLLAFVADQDVDIKTYEGASLIDSRTITVSSDYAYVIYNLIGGSSDRIVHVYSTKGTEMLKPITIKVRNKCNKNRILYRNRLGGYDMDYVTIEKKRSIDRQIMRKSLPYSYTYYSDRQITQIGIDEIRNGVIHTEMMSDMHAYQIATSKDVYLYEPDTEWYFSPIVIDTKDVFEESLELSNFKFNFKYSNI